MNPIDVTQRLKDALIRYLLTTFDVNRDGENDALYAAMRVALDADTALVTGPFLELSLPYARGASIRELVGKKILTNQMLKLMNPPIPINVPLYQHQQRAIERIVDNHSVIVSSGTGSGKTEAFMIPILHDLLQNPAQGVRAILIYPLNALVNDQLERLSKLLDGTGITYGRYTSELVQTKKQWLQDTGESKIPDQQVISREQIQNGEKIPNILITNYAMLEYLLLRPNDSRLFERAADWKYIVLDEAHSYSGAKGIEVAYLVRRLKQHLGKVRGDMTCIGTSATLTDDPKQAISFAETLFGEDFTLDDIIFGQSVDELSDEAMYVPSIDAYLKPEWDELLEKLRANTTDVDGVWDTLSNFGLINENATIELDTVPALLYGILKNNAHLRSLRAEMIKQPDVPLALTEAAKHLFPERQTTPEQVQDSRIALHHLVELGAVARPHPDEAALLPARYHLFARSPQGMWACLNPNCEGRAEGHSERWSRLFGSPRLVCDRCECAVYPLSVCRTCGQVYVKTFYAEGQHHTDTTKYVDEITRYFVWSPAEVNAALADREEEEAEVSGNTTQNPTQIDSAATYLCVNADCRREARCTCAKEGRTPHHTPLYRVVSQKSKGKLGAKPEPITLLECCARCGGESKMKGDEIATPITIRGTTPLSVLTMELYRQLPESSDPEIRRKPGGGRKLLSFYDSRQGAARYAAFLQDVFSQDLYRYLVPQAIKELNDKDRAIDLIDLSEKGALIGWNDLRVFQTSLDEEIDAEFEKRPEDRYKSWNSLTSGQRERLQKFIKTRILAEITTSRRGRQSLESLGLLTVRYFEAPPHISDLAAGIGLNEDQTRTLIDYLLDTLRNEKVITLPEGVKRDHPAFGRHEGNAAIVRANPNPVKSEVPWIGATERHIRCRIMALALKAAQRPHDFDSVKRALLAVWEWLIDSERGLMDAEVTGSYRLSASRLFFDTPQEGWKQCSKCQRLRHGTVALPCPAPRCSGIYETVNQEVQHEKNYYHYIFQQGLKPMRVEEHTAQLAPEKAQSYQKRFKDGDINVLSCSTTFEMGIDLGDLQAVVMNNVPPNIANYRQRAGRAGRRAGGTAFIITWATDRPHDQIYYGTPPEMIRGQVRTPRLTLKNFEIQRRHVNALLLSDFLHYLHRQELSELDKMGAFFDPQAMNGRHYDRLADWELTSHLALTRKLNVLASLLEIEAFPLDDMLHNYHDDLAKAEEGFRSASSFYRQQIEVAKRQYAITSGSQGDQWHKQKQNYENLLERLNNDKVIDSLGGRGVLPSYSFPLYTVELELPMEKRWTAKLRLQRELRRAITEFAPGAELVADKRLWKSNGVRILRDAPQVFEYRLCAECNHIQAAQVAGDQVLQSQCPVCETPYTGIKAKTRYLVPDGFSTDPDSGKLAGQYVHFEVVQQNVAVFIPSTNSDLTNIDFIHRSVQSNGKLFYINAGKNGFGYKLCLKCGRHVTTKDGKCPNKMCGGVGEHVHLGHSIPTDTLLIRFKPTAHVPIPGKHALDFWFTLQTALVLGATLALQIERDDIGGTLFPIIYGREWQRSLVLYDNVPGGAGYMRDIDENFPEVVEAALALVRCPYCTEDTSCTRCLRDYGNQVLYPFLKRGTVISFLESLYAHLTDEADTFGVMKLIANNQVEVLWEEIATAKRSIRLAVSRVEEVVPPGKTSSWLDLLYDRMRAGVAVQLLMTDPPIPNHSRASLVEADYLALMMTKGQHLNLRRASTLPQWHVIIDPEDAARRRAIQFLNDTPVLNADLKNPTLFTTTKENGIEQALNDFETTFSQAQIITAQSLHAPAATTVYRINASGRKTKESDIPALVKFFVRPVVQMRISDPYLIDYERIVNRLGAYVQLAADQGVLTRVDVITRDAQLEGKDRHQQKQAFDKLRTRFSNITIEEQRRTDRQEHDRWIEIIRQDSSKARLYIGRGLDFIRFDGTVQSTYLVLEELI